MNAAERIAAAIARLEQLKADAGYVEINGWLAEQTPGDTHRITFIDALSPITNDPLLVTLHRTIDAQIGLLTFTYNYLQRDIRSGSGDEFVQRIEQTVDAILGES